MCIFTTAVVSLLWNICPSGFIIIYYCVVCELNVADWTLCLNFIDSSRDSAYMIHDQAKTFCHL